MKTKIFFLALAASLLILSGCSKKDKNTFSWTNQFKTIENYIGQDSAAVAQQIINDGYVSDPEEPVFLKNDAETGTVYVIEFDVSANQKVNSIEISVRGLKVPDEIASTDGFVDLVKSIGATYTSAYNTVFNFNKCSYENAQGSFQETDYAKLEPMLQQVAGYEPRIIWKGANDSEIEIDREFADNEGFLMSVDITDGNVK